MLSHDSLAVMRGLDPVGSGFIRRSDMLRALSELGMKTLIFGMKTLIFGMKMMVFRSD